MNKIIGRPRKTQISIGDKYAKLWITAIDKFPIVSCLCECGKKFDARIYNILKGSTKSCGCYSSQVTSELNQRLKRTTGFSINKNTREGVIRAGMIDRCYNKNATHYNLYGGKGIIVCQRWLDSYDTFLSDMGVCPDDYTIERKDNNGNYEPSNCYWASRKEQANNRVTNKLLTFNGKTQNVTQWNTELGLGRHVIETRLKRGWTLERALTTK
jgi:hypothetical protein